jgi:hypothetical protein
VDGTIKDLSLGWRLVQTDTDTGVEDAALSSNHVMKAQWLDSPDSKTADFFIPQRYIDDYIIFPCVYRFDGSSWKDFPQNVK